MSKLEKRLYSELDQSRIDEIVENEWLGLGDTSQLQVASPFSARTVYEIENPHIHMLALMRRPEYFSFTCKHLLNKIVPPMQLAILRELWHRPFPMLVGSRGMGKSFLLALYAMLRATLCQGCKIIIVGSAFRQAKVIFEYAEEIWTNAPILRDVCGSEVKNGPRRDIDRCTVRIGDSLIIALPLGDGTKIRGQRANVIIADEWASIPLEVFENVVSGFAAVAMSPIDKLRQVARLRARQRLGLLQEGEGEAPSIPGLTANQTILSGTAYYSFNHFSDYHKRWKAIIESRGDPRKLQEIFGEELPAKFNWRDYSVLRIPVELLPEGFMDDRHIAKAKATLHKAQFLMEYGACFAGDSNGFYKRSLVESCVCKNTVPIVLPTGEVWFNAVLRGDPSRHYVYGVDPASEQDNFSIIVLECWPEHRRIVHCWTTTRSRHLQRVKRGLSEDRDFYGFAARKIRELMRVFPTRRIALDSQGGGIAVMEALHDPEKLKEGELALWPVVDPDKPNDTDGYVGEHVLEMVQFARADWVSEANHGMRKDFEDKALLFPAYDPAVVGLAIEEDKLLGRVVISPEGAEEKLYDTLEDCVLEIEELKDELASIVHTQTGATLRDRWDTPEVKQPGGKKGRLRKDRYSALLMANMAARLLQRAPRAHEYSFAGGFARDLLKGERPGRSRWQNPSWYTEAAGAALQGKRQK